MGLTVATVSEDRPVLGRVAVYSCSIYQLRTNFELSWSIYQETFQDLAYSGAAE